MAKDTGQTDTKTNHLGWTGFFNKNGDLVARYHEASGRLQVRGLSS